MKGMNLFCSSISSTAVTDHHSKVRKSTKRLASIPRKSQLRVPCSSRLLPINPKPQNGEVRRKGSNIQVNNLCGTSSSTRYLLSDWVSESDKIPSHSHKPTLQNQIVVLRVSLHCKARAGKVTKHISKMEGVTSFSIDMEAKKVTIIGHVTPLGVLASVSKVKNAQLWPSSTSSLPSLSSSMPRYNEWEQEEQLWRSNINY
ncbi:hypothetical protein AAZV13_13G291700 [Glycine max]|uniref:uncharacterized protein isoform X2 n=1 Tax=Glycine max TaxID=3847 RepID=UPI001B357ABA|nr:uncharacterized protein LOC100780839 isoform X2 [Glycine max]